MSIQTYAKMKLTYARAFFIAMLLIVTTISRGNESFQKDSCFVDFSYNFKNGTVCFYYQSNCDLKSIKWNFGDGYTSLLKSPIHTYQKKIIKVNVCLTAITTLDSCNICKDVIVRSEDIRQTDILIRYIEHETSSSENIMVDKWLKQSSDNKNYFMYIEGIWRCTNIDSGYNFANMHKANNSPSKVNDDNLSSDSFHNLFYRIIIFIIILVGASIYFYKRNH